MLELPTIVERFATDFDGLSEIVDGVPAGRMLITSGVLVRAIAVFGLATSDTTNDLIGITAEPWTLKDVPSEYRARYRACAASATAGSRCHPSV